MSEGEGGRLYLVLSLLLLLLLLLLPPPLLLLGYRSGGKDLAI